MNKNNSRLVWSSDSGRMCPKCSKAIAACICKQHVATPPKDSVIRIGRETKGRKGKGVTIITGIPLAGDALKKLAKELKQRCGTGGTIKDGIVEIQGDHRELLLEVIKAKGWQVKLSGG